MFRSNLLEVVYLLSAARARGFPRSESRLTGVFCHITHTFRATCVRAGFDPDPHPSTKKVKSTLTEQNWPRSCSLQKTELHTTRFGDSEIRITCTCRFAWGYLSDLRVRVLLKPQVTHAHQTRMSCVTATEPRLMTGDGGPQTRTEV